MTASHRTTRQVMPQLESGQGFITRPLKALGYNPNPLGMCWGITGLYIQLTVLDNESFNKIVEFIRSRQNLVEDLKKQPLTGELERISTSFKMIKSCQEFQDPKLFTLPNGLPLHPHDLESFSKIAGTDEVKAQGGLARVYLDENMYTPVEWCGYLEKLREVYQKIHREVKETPFNLSMYMTLNFDDCSHAIGLSYDAKEDLWILADPCHLPAFPVPSAEKFQENIFGTDPEEWKLQPEKAYQNVFIIKILKLFYEKYITTNYISSSIEVFTVQNHPELSKIKSVFQKFKSSKSSYCAPLHEIIKRRTRNGRGLVHLVAEADDVEKMEDIVEANGDINLFGKRTYPLNRASSHGSTKVVRYLCKPEFKIDLDQLSEEGFTAAFIAVQCNRPEVLTILGDAGANLSKACKEGYTPLHKAALDGLLAPLKVLLKPEYKINLNCANDNGATPVFYSAQNNHADVLLQLINAGADLMKSNKDGWLPLHIAAQEGSVDALKVLLKSEFKINPDQETKDGFTAVYIAAAHNQVSILEILANSGANTHKTNKGWAPLHIAAQNGHSKIITCLLQLDSKIDLNVTIPSGETAAFIAAQHNHFEFLKILAEKGANINLPRKNGINALHMAAIRGYIDTVKILLEHKCDIFKEDIEGHTAFYHAVTENHFEVGEQLLKGSNLYKLNKEDMELLRQHSNKFPSLRDKISSNIAVFNSGMFVRDLIKMTHIPSAACLVM